MAPVAAKNRAVPVLFGASVSPGCYSRAQARQSPPGARWALQPDGSLGDGPGGPPRVQARLPRPLGPRSPPAARGSPAGPLRKMAAAAKHAFPPLLNHRPGGCLRKGPRAPTLVTFGRPGHPLIAGLACMSVCRDHHPLAPSTTTKTRGSRSYYLWCPRAPAVLKRFCGWILWD